VTLLVLPLALAAALALQQPAAPGVESTQGAQSPKTASEEEQAALENALRDAGNSPADFIRALEAHLARYPGTPRRAEIEAALAKAAIGAGDERRIVEYGERVLARDDTDFQLLERVSRELLGSDAKDRAARALKYARRYENLLLEAGDNKPSGSVSPGEWREELERGLGRAYVLQARATGNLGRIDEAVALAQKSFDTYPNAESAREIARWLARSGREEEAVPHLADAFVIADPRQDDAHRAADRARLGELYRKLHGGSEQGLGDIVLQAYDRTSALINERRLRIKRIDPNLRETDPMQFTLTGVQGDTLSMQSLKGKVVVMDFWATWCGPCRVQHPLYEEVKRRFKDRGDVVFLSINADENRAGVEEFLEKNRWDKRVYYESGLSAALRISAIPTALIINRRGEIASRMSGFVPDRFVDLLTERIKQALTE